MLGFRDLFGIPPHAYHRRLRLSAARRQLLRSWPGETSVTAVAMRWGFDHFGRFSVDYRRVFGESPIATLQGAAKAEYYRIEAEVMVLEYDPGSESRKKSD
jgi:AraC-like DNA-binding protein